MVVLIIWLNVNNIPKLPLDIQDNLIIELEGIDNGKFSKNEQSKILVYKKAIINKYIN